MGAVKMRVEGEEDDAVGAVPEEMVWFAGFFILSMSLLSLSVSSLSLSLCHISLPLSLTRPKAALEHTFMNNKKPTG